MTVTVSAAPPKRRRAIAIWGVLAAVIVTVLLATELPGGDHSRDALRRAPGPAGVAAAYGYPLRCLSVAIALHDPRFARADFDRAVPCGRFTGSVTAIFRRVDGAWVPVLDAASYPCPVRSLPEPVQVELGVCLPPRAAHARRARGRSRVRPATRTRRTANSARASSKAGA